MKEKFKIHFAYIISILVIIIICLIAIKWSEVYELVRIVDFAATLTSLVLALLAIVYAFYSNSSTVNNVYKLNEASNNINKTSQSLSLIVKELNSEVKQIHPVLKEVEKKTRHTNNLLEELNSSNSNQDSAELGRISVENLLKHSSISGLMTLYAIQICFNSRKKVDIEKLEEIIYKRHSDYIDGFLVCIEAINIIKTDRGEGFLIIQNVNPIIQNANLRENIINRTKEIEILTEESIEKSLMEIETEFK